MNFGSLPNVEAPDPAQPENAPSSGASAAQVNLDIERQRINNAVSGSRSASMAHVS